MKDNRKSPFVSDLSKVVRGESGREQFTLKSYVRFVDADQSSASTLYKDLVKAGTSYRVVDATENVGFFNAVRTAMTFPNSQATLPYGQQVFANITYQNGTQQTALLPQKGYTFPLDGDNGSAYPNGIATGRKFLVRDNCSDIDPSNLEKIQMV